jgi:hypothetical protein
MQSQLEFPATLTLSLLTVLRRFGHADRTYPEAPVTMHPSPVRPRIGLTPVAAISFQIVLASGHLVSNAVEYSPRRAA